MATSPQTRFTARSFCVELTPAMGWDLARAEDADVHPVLSHVGVLWRASPHQVVQRVDLGLDPDLLGDVERRVQAEPHVGAGDAVPAAEARRAGELPSGRGNSQ